MRYLILDVEATCWPPETTFRRDQMEIIEIGAVMLRDDFSVGGEFGSFVRPVVHPRLSEFCVSLTSIQQTDVDAADPFGPVYWRFVDWVGSEPLLFCSWGYYDVRQFETDCRRAGVPFPQWMAGHHVNLKTEFAAWRNIRRCGMAKALERLGLPGEGTLHRGIDDARNIARIAQKMLPARSVVGRDPLVGALGRHTT